MTCIQAKISFEVPGEEEEYLVADPVAVEGLVRR